MSNQVQNPLSIKLKVEVLEVHETIHVGQSGMQKREIVVKTIDEQYPQVFKVEFIKDKVSILDSILPLMTVTVSINVRGNKHVTADGREMYFQSMQGWKIELA